MKSLTRVTRWLSMMAIVLSTATFSAQAERGPFPVSQGSGDVVIFKDGEASQVLRSPEAKPKPIALSDPELEERIRAVGSRALSERAEPGAMVAPAWSPDSPEFKLAKQVDAQLQAKREAEMEARRESLTPLERMAVFDIFGVVDDEDLAPHRFSDTSGLVSMLHNPFWARYWGSIAVTIARVADEEGTMELIEFIKNPELPEGYEREANEARLRAIKALPEALKGQEVAGVHEFLLQLTDSDFLRSLGFSRPNTQNAMARYNSYYALGAIGDEKSLNALEQLHREAKAEKPGLEQQPLSNGRKPDEEASQNLTLLERHLNRARSKQLGVPDTLDGTEDPGYSR